MLGDFEERDELGGGEELHPFAESAEGEAQRNRRVRLSRPRAADQAAVEVQIDPFAAGQFEDLLFGDVRRGGEVEGVEVFDGREGGGVDPRGHGVGGPGRDRQFGELQ